MISGDNSATVLMFPLFMRVMGAMGVMRAMGRGQSVSFIGRFRSFRFVDPVLAIGLGPCVRAGRLL